MNAANEQDMLAESLARVLADHTPAMHRPGGAALLWKDLDQAGFPRALAAESAGGSGVGWADAFSLFALLGQTAAPVPLAESMIAHWLLGTAGLQAGEGLLSLAAVRAPLELVAADGGLRLSGALPRVPWGRESARVVTITLLAGQPHLVGIDCKAPGVRLEHGQDVAGEPRDSLVLAGVTPEVCRPTHLLPIDLMAIAAVTRAAQMAGGLRAILSSAVAYANLRVQFGRSLSQFQAIQHKLASMATQTAAALAAAQAGLEAIDTLLDGVAPPGTADTSAIASTGGRIADSIEAATAKIRAGEAAGLGAAVAHQVFGAIGFTEEHSLHLHTRRLWSWRDEYGNEAFWSRRLGEAFIAAGSRQVWQRVTARAGAHGQPARQQSGRPA